MCAKNIKCENIQNASLSRDKALIEHSDVTLFYVYIHKLYTF